jgi:hypothetical protein
MIWVMEEHHLLSTLLMLLDANPHLFLLEAKKFLLDLYFFILPVQYFSHLLVLLLLILL